jgi:hypothetical protein
LPPPPPPPGFGAVTQKYKRLHRGCAPTDASEANFGEFIF